MALRDELMSEGIERLTLVEDRYGAGLYVQSVYLVPISAAYRDDPEGYAEVRQEILDCDAPGTWLEPAPVGGTP